VGGVRDLWFTLGCTIVDGVFVVAVVVMHGLAVRNKVGGRFEPGPERIIGLLYRPAGLIESTVLLSLGKTWIPHCAEVEQFSPDYRILSSRDRSG